MKEFREKLSSLLMKTYGVSIGDCLDESTIENSFKDGETVEELVEWVGEKYNLDPINEIVKPL